MYTLGINAAFHDPAAALLCNGQLLAAAEEERFTHVKHGKRPIPFEAWALPFNAISYCLSEAGIHLRDVDQIAYSFDPGRFNSMPEEESEQAKFYASWDPLFSTYLNSAPEQLRDGYPFHLQQRFAGAGDLRRKWHYVEHHIAHAASAFYPSPYDTAAVMTIDGRGESATTSYFNGKGNWLQKIGEVHMPHSLGMLYEIITAHLGFLRSSDEYKVMALASYGSPKYLDQFRSLIRYSNNGSYTIAAFDATELFGPARRKGDPLLQVHFDIAHSLQKVLEETVLQLASWLQQQTEQENCCLAGGVALNCVLNGVLQRSGPFKNIWVQPAAGDAGTAPGAAWWIERQYLQQQPVMPMQHVYLGPSFTDEEVERWLQWMKLPYRKMEDVATETAQLLASGKIIGWFQGRMEFGPRALGSRSILASPLEADMQQKLNNIKDREDFRPVAPVVPEEEADQWF